MNKILAVDDDQQQLNAIKRIFSKQKQTLFFALNGKDAIAQVKKEIPSIVILDIMMPGMNGIEACARLMDEYQGFIDVKNNEHGGSIFTIRIPINQ